MHQAEKPKTVGDFYGFHHSQVETFSDLSSLVVSPQEIRGWIGLPLPDIENLSFLQAGGIGAKAVSLSLAGIKDVTFFDLSEESINHIQNLNPKLPHPVKTIHGNLMEEQPNLRKRFDVILCQGVLHHTPCPSKGLVVLHQMLKPGALLNVNFYYSGSLIFFWVAAFRWLIKSTTIDYEGLREIIMNSGYAEFYAKYNCRYILDHAFVPILQPADPYIVRNDFKKIGYAIIKDDPGGGPPDLNSNKPRMEFVLKNVADKEVDPPTLEYQQGKDQLRLYEGKDVEIFLSRLQKATEILPQIGLTDEACEILVKFLNVSYRAGQFTNLRMRLGGIKRLKEPRFLLPYETPRSYFLREASKLLEKL